MRCKGTPTYTQDTIAFPDPINTAAREQRRIMDAVSISFDADDGGTYGGFQFTWHDHSRVSRRPSVALRVESFGDGLVALLDDRMLGLLHQLRREEDGGTPTPGELIEMLEELGVQPSRYHLNGLVENGDDLDRLVARERLTKLYGTESRS